jgi:hypothetical protein
MSGEAGFFEFTRFLRQKWVLEDRKRVPDWGQMQNSGANHSENSRFWACLSILAAIPATV